MVVANLEYTAEVYYIHVYSGLIKDLLTFWRRKRGVTSLSLFLVPNVYHYFHNDTIYFAGQTEYYNIQIVKQLW